MLKQSYTIKAQWKWLRYYESWKAWARSIFYVLVFSSLMMTSIINEVMQQPPSASCLLSVTVCHKYRSLYTSWFLLLCHQYHGSFLVNPGNRPHSLLYLYYNLLYIYIWVDLKIKLLLNPLVNPHFPIQLTISWVKNASIHLDPTGEAATLSSWSPQKLPSGRITKRWENLM